MLQGCPEFMEELKKFDQEHQFPIGAGHVVIRGGAGRPKGTVERARGSRAGRQRQQRHQLEEYQPRQQQRSEQRRQDNVRTYDHNFPAWGEAETMTGIVTGAAQGTGEAGTSSQMRRGA